MDEGTGERELDYKGWPPGFAELLKRKQDCQGLNIVTNVQALASLPAFHVLGLRTRQ